eukprot:45875-Rhodomonas_salina.5
MCWAARGRAVPALVALQDVLCTGSGMLDVSARGQRLHRPRRRFWQHQSGPGPEDRGLLGYAAGCVEPDPQAPSARWSSALRALPDHHVWDLGSRV